MKLVPHQKITYQTQLTPVQVRQQLVNNIVENDNTLFIKTKMRNPFKQSADTFQGAALQHSFTISRIPGYHTPSLPVAHGKVIENVMQNGTTPNITSTKIQVSMQVQPMLMIAVGIFVFMLLNMVNMFAKNPNFLLITFIVVLVVFAPVYFAIVYGFHQEVARVDAFLLQTLEAVHQ